jgi:hypothetical protein
MNALITLLITDTNAANAFGALASATAALLGLVVSAIAVGISILAVRSQRIHNELSVRPLAEVTVADYENSLRVKLCNNGTGPMIVTNVTVSDGSSGSKPCIVEWMPELSNRRSWTTFSNELRDRTLQAGSEIVLLELTQNKGERNFVRHRDKVRAALAPLTVCVEYTDIYNKAMPARVKDLSWFGRHK